LFKEKGQYGGERQRKGLTNDHKKHRKERGTRKRLGYNNGLLLGEKGLTEKGSKEEVAKPTQG